MTNTVKFKLSQRTADRLMKLYREMDMVTPKDFHQSECHACVIGHGIRNGAMNGFGFIGDFPLAVKWVGLPSTRVDSGDEYFNLLEDYLFGSTVTIYFAGIELNLPSREMISEDELTPKDAQNRIVAVLEAGGYDVVWDRP